MLVLEISFERSRVEILSNRLILHYQQSYLLTKTLYNRSCLILSKIYISSKYFGGISLKTHNCCKILRLVFVIEKIGNVYHKILSGSTNWLALVRAGCWTGLAIKRRFTVLPRLLEKNANKLSNKIASRAARGTG